MVFTDSSFTNNADLTTQLGFIILFTDQTGRANTLHYASYNYKRMVRSVLGCETYDIEDRFGESYMMHLYLEDLFQKRIPITVLTDLESLFRVILRASVTTEKSLMFDVKAAW